MKYSKISFKNTVVAIQRWRSSEVTLRTRNIIGIAWKNENSEVLSRKTSFGIDLSIQRRIYDLNGTFIQVFRAHWVRVWIHRCFFLSRVFSHTEFSQFMHRFKDFGSQNFHPTIRLKWSYQKFREGTIYYK